MWWILQTAAFFYSLTRFSQLVNAALIARGWSPRALPCWAWGWVLYCGVYYLAKILHFSHFSLFALFSAIAWSLSLEGLGRLWIRSSLANSSIVTAKFSWSEALRYRFFSISPHLWGLVIFWGVAWSVGTYLEFPADPLEHLQRIQAWKTIDSLSSLQGASAAFPYFLNHWLLSGTDWGKGSRIALDALNATWQTLLLAEFIQLTWQFSGKMSIGWLGGFASLIFFGTSVFSFFRYYSFANSFLGYLIFLEALGLLRLFFLSERWKYGLLILPLLGVMAECHGQTIIFLGNAFCGGAILFLVRGKLKGNFRSFALVGVISAGIFLILGSSQIKWRYHDYLKTDEERQLRYLWILGKELPEGEILPRLIFPQRLHTTVGFWGWLAFLSAAVTWLWPRVNRSLLLLSGWTFWPLVMLSNPWSLGLLLQVSPVSSLYRLLYGSIYWIWGAVFVGGVWRWASPWLEDALARYGNWLTLYRLNGILCVIGLGIGAWSGRLEHLLYQPKEARDGRDLIPLLEILKKSPTPENCFTSQQKISGKVWILTDAYTNSYLEATGDFYVYSSRRYWKGTQSPVPPFHITPEDLTPEAFRQQVPSVTIFDEAHWLQTIQNQPLCWIYLAPRLRPESKMGLLSGHWEAEAGNSQAEYQQWPHWIKKHPEMFQMVWQEEGRQLFAVKHSPSPLFKD